MIKKSLIICFISLLCLVGCNHDGLPTDDTTAPDNVTETVKDQAVKMTIDKPIEIDQIKSGSIFGFISLLNNLQIIVFYLTLIVNTRHE